MADLSDVYGALMRLCDAVESLKASETDNILRDMVALLQVQNERLEGIEGALDQLSDSLDRIDRTGIVNR